MQLRRSIMPATAIALTVAVTSLLAPVTAAGDPTWPLSTDSIMSTVTDLTEMAPRATGSPGGARAADYVQERFTAAGLQVHVEENSSYDWIASDHALHVGASRIDANPVSHSFIGADARASYRTTGPDGLEAEVVDIGRGDGSGVDMSGKIVLFDLSFYLPLVGLLPLAEHINDPDGLRFDPDTLLSANPYLTSLESTVRTAMAGGAVGFIGVLADYFDSNRYHNEYYRRLAVTLPGMWVTAKDGAALRASLPGNGNRARIDLTVDRREVTARTVVGMLPGRTNDTVMVQSHHDSVGPGAVEDATGTAEVIALAEHYGALATQPGYEPREKSLMFVTFDTHFTGYQAHMAFVDKYITSPSTPWRIVANATIEHVGKHARKNVDGTLVTLDVPEPKGVFETVNLGLKLDMADALARNDVRATTMLNGAPFDYFRLGVPTDASFVLAAGIPTISFIAGPLYMYDDADTIDKVDRSQLTPVALFFRDMLDRIDREPSDSIGLIPAGIR